LRIQMMHHQELHVRYQQTRESKLLASLHRRRQTWRARHLQSPENPGPRPIHNHNLADIRFSTFFAAESLPVILLLPEVHRRITTRRPPTRAQIRAAVNPSKYRAITWHELLPLRHIVNRCLSIIKHNSRHNFLHIKQTQCRMAIERTPLQLRLALFQVYIQRNLLPMQYPRGSLVHTDYVVNLRGHQ
jgi:hypothetical protein